MAPNTTPSSGDVSREGSVLDAPLVQSVHPTAARRPADLITVQSANTTYTDEHITSRFTNRGADVVVEQDGRYLVQPSATDYDFRTTRKVPKTG
jgi:myo-inositol-1-phosphate synthase